MFDASWSGLKSMPIAKVSSFKKSRPTLDLNWTSSWISLLPLINVHKIKLLIHAHSPTNKDVYLLGIQILWSRPLNLWVPSRF